YGHQRRPRSHWPHCSYRRRRPSHPFPRLSLRHHPHPHDGHRPHWVYLKFVCDLESSPLAQPPRRTMAPEALEPSKKAIRTISDRSVNPYAHPARRRMDHASTRPPRPALFLSAAVLLSLGHLLHLFFQPLVQFLAESHRHLKRSLIPRQNQDIAR